MESPAANAADVKLDDHARKDIRTLAMFVDLFCRSKHAQAGRSTVIFKIAGEDISAIAARPLCLCVDCRRLLAHAAVKRSHCPLDPKPSCKHCPVHCYHPVYRTRMQEVMRFSGRKMVLSGRLDYLAQLLL
jgi:hypothetical protein